MKNVLIVVSFFSLAFFSCSAPSVKQNDAETLLSEAEDEIAHYHYQMAIEKLQMVKNKFPYSQVAIDSQLRIADVYFLQELYVEAAASYEVFLDLHPKNHRADYAMYKIGKSYFQDIPSVIMRDLTNAQKALLAYEKFLKRFPNSDQAEDAKKDVLYVKKLLAEKECVVAEFYLKKNFYHAAKNRFQKVIDLYPETEFFKIAKEKLFSIHEEIAKESTEKNKIDQNL